MQFLQSKGFTQKAKDYLTMESLREKWIGVLTKEKNKERTHMSC